MLVLVVIDMQVLLPEARWLRIPTSAVPVTSPWRVNKFRHELEELEFRGTSSRRLRSPIIRIALNMSSASFAALRKSQGDEFAKLAEERK